MTIWNLGSINIDHVYQVQDFVAPGETLGVQGYSWGLGGKGLNQSVAIARSGGQVQHMGAIGSGDRDTRWAIENLGLDQHMAHIHEVAGPTGHAIIQVNAAGENCILLAPGANRALDELRLKDAFDQTMEGDWLLLQNETSAGEMAVTRAKARGMRVCYAAAPFEAAAVAALIDQIDLLSVNEVELAQLEAAMTLSGVARLVTLGSKGAYYEDEQGTRTTVEACSVTPIDTTGAGDTFLGAFLARLDAGQDLPACLHWAAAAAALQVMRQGAAPAIPASVEIESFLKAQRP